MDPGLLKKFLLEANQHGYGNEATKITKEADGSETITYEQGGWKLHDNWVGGVRFGGRDVVFYENVPVWIMTYYGYPLTDQIDASELYVFLKRALMKMPTQLPLRGPELFKEGDWTYSLTVDGNIDNFTAIENIRFQENEVYEAHLIGGLVGD